MGKQTKINLAANRELKRQYQKWGITHCELCGTDNFLSFAHRHKRRHYYGQPQKLVLYNQTLLLCVPCHQRLEMNKELTKSIFKRLRGDDQLE